MLGAEARRSGQKYDIDPAFQHFLIRVHPGETALFRDLGTVSEVFQISQGGRDLTGEGIAHGPKHGVFISGKRLAGGSSSASASADQADLELRVVGGCAKNDLWERGKSCGGSCAFEERTAVGFQNIHGEYYTC